ncbi:hypothetical protein Agabi119p4_8467 [Agaricus bisporus var. burnettii]|uniref:Tyr recombinase domain-containing protein n=1 Tax=Agaricus bisporus var. burnettii TaxID=192524 RepID=A0A8H7C762_AGABI|nr:hypothetical protein Agabi119p4_8467 [Agaricus bisporus var. burnettii]
MAKFISPSSIDSYLSGIIFKLRQQYPRVTEIRNSDHIRLVLRGVKRRHGRPTSRKAPITFKQLEHLFSLFPSASYDDRLFLAVISTAFFGLLRLGEVTDSNDSRLRDRRKTTRRDSLEITAEYASFILPASKTDKFFAGNQVLLRHNNRANDPVNALSAYVTLRDRLFPDVPWLWLTSQGCPPTRRWFLARFHLHFDAQFGGHSMRAGGATLLAQHGVPFEIIQAIGRWSSETFRIYIRTHPTLLLPATPHAQPHAQPTQS